MAGAGHVSREQRKITDVFAAMQAFKVAGKVSGRAEWRDQYFDERRVFVPPGQVNLITDAM